MSEHVASRPSWDCAACEKPWPCDPAREQMMIETGGGTALRVLAWFYLEQYSVDVAPGPFTGAFDRFMAWT